MVLQIAVKDIGQLTDFATMTQRAPEPDKGIPEAHARPRGSASSQPRTERHRSAQIISAGNRPD
jgi:hypothetical protein